MLSEAKHKQAIEHRDEPFARRDLLADEVSHDAAEDHADAGCQHETRAPTAALPGAIA